MSLMDRILATLDDTATAFNKRTTFARYRRALATANATGEQADIDAARALQNELNALFDLADQGH
jgi:hypothetical protein